MGYRRRKIAGSTFVKPDLEGNAVIHCLRGGVRHATSRFAAQAHPTDPDKNSGAPAIINPWARGRACLDSTIRGVFSAKPGRIGSLFRKRQAITS